MTKAQEIDYAYHEERLLLLIARRSKLPAGSDQIPALDAELISIEDLVRSYRLVGAHKSAGCPDSTHSHGVPAILSNAPPPRQR
jgi:hypothetical protein